MPADRRTPLPTQHGGELEAARELCDLSTDAVHVWFDVDDLPGVRQMDQIIWHEDCGVFVVEVKAVPIEAIESFNYKNISIAGRGQTISPQMQAREQAMGLRTHFKVNGIDCPRLIPTVWFSKITREEWNRRWKDTMVGGDFSTRLLFADDVSTNAAVLRNRLEHIRRNPPIGVGTPREFRHSLRAMEAFHKGLVPGTEAPAIASDTTRMLTLEREAEKSAIQDAPPDECTHLIYRGYPGTGKTFRLLAIGVAHALQGKNVLFSCFNKVLAADIKRLLSTSKRLRSAKGSIAVRDIFEIATDYQRELNGGHGGHEWQELHSYDDSYDEWGAMITERVEEDLYVFPYDTILVDEAQDMKDWQYRLLSTHDSGGASMIFAAGTGQELYGEGSGDLKAFQDKQSTRIMQLRRNFRNQGKTFQLAQIAFQAELNVDRIAKVAKKYRDKEAELVLFDHTSGRLPEVEVIDRTSLPWEHQDSAFFEMEQRTFMVNEYKGCIERQWQALQAKGGCAQDLLILVPGNDAAEAEWARLALQALELPFIDLTIKKQRRRVVPPTHVRLCTFHSARGIEGSHVITFGLNTLGHQRDKVSGHKLAYIVLSRSTLSTVIVLKDSDTSHKIGHFIQEAMNHIRGDV